MTQILFVGTLGGAVGGTWFLTRKTLMERKVLEGPTAVGKRGGDSGEFVSLSPVERWRSVTFRSTAMKGRKRTSKS